MTVTVPESLVPLLYGVLVVLGVSDQPVHVGPGQVIRLAALAPHVPRSLSVSLSPCVTLTPRCHMAHVISRTEAGYHGSGDTGRVATSGR